MFESQRETSLRFLAQPNEVNFGGNVHGGAVMKWIDQAGYVCATGWSGCYCVTAFIGDVNFYEPIHVGDLVQVNAKIIHTGRTSMHIAVDLHACNPKRCERSKAIHCVMVFVAVDEHGHAMEVPAWIPNDEEDLMLEDYALKIMELRKTNQKLLQAQGL